MMKASGELVKKLKKQKRENDFLLFLDNQKIINDAISQGAFGPIPDNAVIPVKVPSGTPMLCSTTLSK